MGDLSPADFAAYFQAIHGHAPFPWQSRLLARVASEGAWPKLLDIPTGAGKTAAIDVALFHLALDPARAPRRIVMVVDRRTVVDQAFSRAREIQSRLAAAKGGVLGEVASRLRALGVAAAPLAIAQLRGGIPRDDAWARRPDQALVAVSTVDQVGSRLLFRGYGVSDAMRPIHAGLLGNDTLILLDEVHLSGPFRETLEAITRYRGWAREGLPDRFRVVEMSATAGVNHQERERFTLEDEDRRDGLLARRLGASKPVELGEPVKREAFVEACADRAARFAAPGRAVGVVVNRVATARDVFAAVEKRLGDKARVFLVTGRMRPLDRDDLDQALSPLVRSGRERSAGAVPVVVVSTQCIEAGADFDFDALVTECASLDALRQRFGRLNRLGEIEDARAVVLARAESLGKEADPIYGEALAKTWRWLREAPRDFGIDAMDRALPTGDALRELLMPSSRAPVMLPAHLDLWSQTKPAPRPDPEVALWLHGIEQRHEADVTLVWRADVTTALLEAAEKESAARDALLARVEACPPSSLEALAVPIGAARRWLAGEPAAELADVERAIPDEGRGAGGHKARRALVWRGDESAIVGADDLRPEMTLVVPSPYGGIAQGVWDPSSVTPVTDLGDRARWEQTRRPILRLHPAIVPADWAEVPRPAAEDSESDEREEVMSWLEAMRAVAVDPWRRRALEALGRSARRRAIVRVPGAAEETPYLALIGRAPVLDGDGGDATTEGDGGSHTGVEVPLREHLGGVARWARRFAEGCGLPEAMVSDLELAGRWHDVGKVDPRFQTMLHGGSAYRAEVAAEPLAKSAMVMGDRAARARARERAGYPVGTRHELASVSLMLSIGEPLLALAHDRDLVLHLVASHHGHCRPFAPVAEDTAPVELALDAASLALLPGDQVIRVSSDHGLSRLDSGVADRFWRLTERYGWYGLSWLEAILRLADHRRSEEEQEMKEAR